MTERNPSDADSEVNCAKRTDYAALRRVTSRTTSRRRRDPRRRSAAARERCRCRRAPRHRRRRDRRWSGRSGRRSRRCARSAATNGARRPALRFSNDSAFSTAAVAPIDRERGALLRLPAVAFVNGEDERRLRPRRASLVVIVRHAGICCCAVHHAASRPSVDIRRPARVARPARDVRPAAPRPQRAAPAALRRRCDRRDCSAHGYEIGTAPATTIASGIADQMPMTLCQLKSRAFGASPPRNHNTFLNWIHFQTRGSHRYMPLSTMNRKTKFGGAGDRPAGGAARAFERQVAMPHRHGPEERAQAGRRFADDRRRCRDRPAGSCCLRASPSPAPTASARSVRPVGAAPGWASITFASSVSGGRGRASAGDGAVQARRSAHSSICFS